MFLVTACSRLIEYSPYDESVDPLDLNSKAIEKIKQMDAGNDTISFAMLSDVHENYDDLADALRCINKQKGLKFIVCCGDVTNAGLAQEYDWYASVIGKSVYPLVTVIGNHDYLSNGRVNFNKLIGVPNTSFIIGKYKFILFDDIVWENDCKMPEFDWLSEELSDTLYNNILMSHIPPYSDDLKGEYGYKYKNIVDSTKALLCLYGHTHTYTETYFDGIPVFVAGDIDDREYYIISIIRNKPIIKRMKF